MSLRRHCRHPKRQLTVRRELQRLGISRPSVESEVEICSRTWELRNLSRISRECVSPSVSRGSIYWRCRRGLCLGRRISRTTVTIWTSSSWIRPSIVSNGSNTLSRSIVTKWWRPSKLWTRSSLGARRIQPTADSEPVIPELPSSACWRTSGGRDWRILGIGICSLTER